MEKLGFPFLLVGTVWGLFTPALKVIEMTNDRRDKILSPDSKFDLAHKKLILYSDWLTLWVAMYVYAIALGVLTLFYPVLMPPEFVATRAARVACYATGLVILASAAAGIASGLLDFRHMRRHLNEAASKAAPSEGEVGVAGRPDIS